MNKLNDLNNLIIEFYDKLSSWEQSVVKETGYSLAQIHTIEVLGSHGAMRMKELSGRLGITTGTLTVQVEKLVKLDLMIKRAHCEDKRSTIVDLTSHGRDLYQHHNDLHVQLTEDITRQLDDESIANLENYLVKVNREF